MATDSYTELSAEAGPCCLVNLAVLLWKPEFCHLSGSLGWGGGGWGRGWQGGGRRCPLGVERPGKVGAGGREVENELGR